MKVQTPLRSFVFRGTKDYATKQVQEMLGLGKGAPQGQQGTCHHLFTSPVTL